MDTIILNNITIRSNNNKQTTEIKSIRILDDNSTKPLNNEIINGNLFDIRNSKSVTINDLQFSNYSMTNSILFNFSSIDNITIS
jgi:hypothetical protein